MVVSLRLQTMSILYNDDDGYFISHKLYISKLYDSIMNKTDNSVNLYEHFFHIHNPFVRDEQKPLTDTENDGVNRKRKRQKFEVFFFYKLIPITYL